MTTSEFIKMLQEADPSGEAHVRMEGGVPIFATYKEGYWDGPYCYIDKDNKYVMSTKGMKVDICCKEPESYIYDDLNWNSYKESEEGLFEKLKSHFRFELNYSIAEHRQEREDQFFEPLKEALDEYIAHKKKSDQRWLKQAIEGYNKGDRYHQKIESDFNEYENNFYDWKIIAGGKVSGASWSISGPILLSGQFESSPSETEGYIEWKPKRK